MITSVETFEWFPLAMVFAMSLGWFVVDTVNLWGELSKPEREPDRVFGYFVGLVLAALGGVAFVLYVS